MATKAVWTGRILNWASGFFMLTSGINLGLVQSEGVREGFAAFGYPEATIPLIGAAAFVSAVLYLIPRTAVLGAILLTGYLGGAVATHTRILDPTAAAPFVVGVVVWLGLYLQDERLRALLPLRR